MNALSSLVKQRLQAALESARRGWFASCASRKTAAWALSPLLVVYLAVTLLNRPQDWVADEVRYLRFAQHLCQGGYALADDEFLWNGPGYPVVLAAWIRVGLPPEEARWLNAGFLYLAVVLFAHWLALYVPRRWALGTAGLMGLHAPLFMGLGKLMTEPLAVCLVCGFFLAAEISMRTGRWRAIALAGWLLAWLALTKVFFGYVLLCGLCGHSLLVAFAWRDAAKRRMVAVYLTGLLCTLPYLTYTYQLTGRLFYWSNSGGLSLYWMATPVDGEWGDWFHPRDVERNPELWRHRAFFASLAGMSPVEKDDASRREAIRRIAAHPKKFLVNVAANAARLWFSFPYSYTPQKLSTLFYVLPNSFLLSALLLSGAVLWHRRPAGLRDCHGVMLFTLFAMGGSCLLSAYARMLDPLVPAAYFFVGLAAPAVWPELGPTERPRYLGEHIPGDGVRP